MRGTLLVVFVLVVVLGALTAGAHLAVGDVAARVHDDPAVLPARSVVIVPGAGLRPDGTPHGSLAARLACAEALFRAGRVHDILVSGDGDSDDHDEARAMQTWLVAAGVPEARVHSDRAGFRTLDTMQRAARVYGVTSAVICTQRLHANRSVYLALDAGIDAHALVAAGDDWLTPAAWLRERAATVVAVFDVIVGTEPRQLDLPAPIGAYGEGEGAGADGTGGVEAGAPRPAASAESAATSAR